MRKSLIVSTFATMLLASSTAHAILDCWAGFSFRDTVCRVFSVAGPKPFDEQAVTCEDVAWLSYDYCPAIEDTGDGTEDDLLLCEDAPLLVEEFCGSQ